MRTVTFLGLAMIAKCIDPVRIGDAINLILLIFITSFIVDFIDTRKKWEKK